MLRRWVNFFSFLIFICTTCFAIDKKDDAPLYIEADHGIFNHTTGVSIYEGHVVVSQGSAKLMADKIIAYNSADDELVELIASGTPAKYQAYPEDKPVFLGVANVIKYHALLKQYELIGNAHAEHDQHQINGPILLYNTDQASLISPAAKAGRTTIVYTPRTMLEKKEKA